MDTETEDFYWRWQITPPEPSMISDCEGRRDPDGFPIALFNLANRVGRKVWSAAVKTAPAPVLTLVLSDQRPWAHAAALAHCATLIAAGEAINVRASSENALDEAVTTLSGLSWRPINLGNLEPDARTSAAIQCGTILSQSGADRDDPRVEVMRSAIAEILTAIGVGGHT